MKEVILFIAVVALVLIAYFQPCASEGRFKLQEATIQEVVGPKNVVQIQKNNVLFRIDTRTGKTWRLVPSQQPSGDHVMGWEEVHDINLVK